MKYAISRGYVINEIYDVLDFEKTEIFMFRPYVDMWLKIKQQASGWPNWCQTQDDKLLYIQKYKDNEGIELEFDKIDKNEALRFIAKIMLNSFWGKLAQKPNKLKTLIVNTYNDYWKIATDTEREIKAE